MEIDEIIEGLERSNKQEELFLNAHSWMESGEIKERKHMIDRDESIIAYLKEFKELKNSTFRRENAGMTSEKAIEVSIKNRMIGSFELADAIYFDIKAIRARPCDDVISREDTLKAMIEHLGIRNEDYLIPAEKTLYKVVKNMPPVNLQPNTGHWYIDERPESNRKVICSNCEQPIFKYYKMDFDYRPKYCPNCGAIMVDLQERRNK